MKVKNVNPLELHVEKITLAVAGAAAVYLAYAAISNPVVVDKGGPLTVDMIQSRIGQSTKELKDRYDENVVLSQKLSASVDNYVEKVKNEAKSPFGAALLASLPRFAPFQVAPSNTYDKNEAGEQIRVATPVVPTPKSLNAVASRGQVLDKPATGDVSASGEKLEVNKDEVMDISWVKITANYPMGQLRQNLAGDNLSNNRRIPDAQLQRPLFWAVVVERQEQNPDGTWPSGGWKPVPQVKWQQQALEDVNKIDLVKGGNNPQYVAKALQTLEAGYAAVLTPDFYFQIDPSKMLMIEPKRKVATEAETDKPAGDRTGTPRTTPTTPTNNRATTPRIPNMPAGVPLPPGFGGGHGTTGGSGSGTRTTGTGSNTPAPSNTTRTPSSTPPSTPTAVNTGTSGVRLPPGVPMPPGFTVPNGVPLPPGFNPNPGNGTDPGAIAGSDPNANPKTKAFNELLEQSEVPIWFYDETVKPDHKYLYRMQVRIFNPLFHLPFPLEDNRKFNQPWLSSAWTTMAEKDAVQINANQHLFVMRGFADGNSPKIRIYQWERGQYVATTESIEIGQKLGHKVTFGDVVVDFKTGYTVVKFDADPRTGDATVVLQSPSGELIVRNSVFDQDDQERTELENLMRNGSPKAPKPEGTK